MQPRDRATYELEHPELAEAIPENEFLKLANKSRPTSIQLTQFATSKEASSVQIMHHASETKTAEELIENKIHKKKKKTVIIAIVSGLAVVLIAAMALVLLNNKHKPRHHKSLSKTEEIDDSMQDIGNVSASIAEAEAAMPIGNPAKDAKMAAQEMIELMNSTDFKSKDDVDKFEKELSAIQDKYEKFYNEKGEDAMKKFKEEFDKLENDPEISGKVEEAVQNMQKKAMEFMK